MNSPLSATRLGAGIAVVFAAFAVAVPALASPAHSTAAVKVTATEFKFGLSTKTERHSNGGALIMTAFGLFVAVPAVLGYNWLVRRNKSAMEDVRSFSADVHSVLISGAMSTSEAGRAAGAKKIG